MAHNALCIYVYSLMPIKIKHILKPTPVKSYLLTRLLNTEKNLNQKVASDWSQLQVT